MKADLLPEETRRLELLEAVIEQGKRSFIEVGIALARVRDDRLWQRDYDSFEEYCQERWGWTKQRAYQLMEAAPIAKSQQLLTTESQARELAKVEPSQRTEVLEKAASKGPVTARAIKEVASALTEPPKPTTDDDKFASAMGGIVHTHAPEPLVTEYYNRLEKLVEDALENATDRQLVSMSVFAAMIPKLIKEQLNARKKDAQ